MKRHLTAFCSILLCFAILFSAAGCSRTPTDEPSAGSNNSEETTQSVSSEKEDEKKDPVAEEISLIRSRQARQTSAPTPPSNEVDEESLPNAPEGMTSADASSFTMSSDQFSLIFVKKGSGYTLQVSDGENAYYASAPVTVTVYSEKDQEELKSVYATVKATSYGCLATSMLRSKNGTQITVEDRYYYPDELPTRAINLRRSVLVKAKANADVGYSTAYAFFTDANASNLHYFVPHTVYNGLKTTGRSGTFAEVELGLPMGALMTKSGFALSLARYQPIIHPEGNYTASITVSDSVGSMEKPGVSVEYPSQLLEQPYFLLASQKRVVFDLTFTGSQRESFNDMMVGVFNDHFLLQDQRIVDTDIDKVWEVICEDYKAFMLSNNGNGHTSYGLPWRVTIENGLIGPKSYQSGFVGQQIPAAYQMMLYGIRNQDQESLQNGLNILNFWIDSGMMNSSGVPKIWYNGDYNVYNSYPTFLRMAIDTMDGYLNAYQLAKENGIECAKWKDALDSFGAFLLKAQNKDGSYFRCYNWSGTFYEAGDDGLPEPAGNICQSTSKENTAMAVGFLADMYLLTGNEDYKKAAIAAGEYVYNNQYARGYYIGGTCDNANVIDKEAGVFALYCYDALYTLTKDEKWIAPMKQAAAFVMSMVQCFSFPAGMDSALKAATGVKLGYNDGSSFITADMDGLDNFAAMIYYHLFRLYVITSDPVYFYQAEFMQQNSKSLMDWDGKLGYSYRSILPEATTIDDFGFHSAMDDQGVEGVWLPWQSVANAAPICDMMLVFGVADVAELAEKPVEELYQILFP